MNPVRSLGRSVCIFGTVVLLAANASAGTNDLFNVISTVKLKVDGKGVRYGNAALINLALNQPAGTTLPPDVALGLQCNCQTLQMDLVLWRPSTLETLATLAAFGVSHVNGNAKIAKVDCIEGAYDPGRSNFVSGAMAHLVIRLATNGCATQTTMTLAGAFAMATINDVTSLTLSKSKIKSFGPQLRPPATAGTNNTYVVFPCDQVITNTTSSESLTPNAAVYKQGMLVSGYNMNSATRVLQVKPRNK